MPQRSLRWLASIAGGALVALSLMVFACGDDDGGSAGNEQGETGASTPDGSPYPTLFIPTAVNTPPPEVTGQATTTASGLQIIDIEAGTGDEAQPGSIVFLRYDSWLAESGRRLDAASDLDPIRFNLSEGRVIQGWVEGISGMKEGGKRRLIVPPELAYGEEGSGNVIPPDATLIYDIELVDVR